MALFTKDLRRLVIGCLAVAGLSGCLPDDPVAPTPPTSAAAAPELTAEHAASTAGETTEPQAPDTGTAFTTATDTHTETDTGTAENGPEPAPAATTGADLAGSHWQLVAFQSMDDAAGVETPADAQRYTMTLNADGGVHMTLNCNSATGNWQADEDNTESGGFTFTGLATTRALCQPPSMDQLVAQQSSHVRSFLLKEGKLYLSLKADGGILVWKPAQE